ENHIRGILNFPLGSTKIIQPSVMINVLGEPGYAGPVFYEGLEACLAEEGIKVHIYGKKETRPMRKMGHITIIAPTVEAAKQKAKWVKQTLKVKA
ncbi:MAG: 5-(carboxyamino)imidazole ribonucleotide synthase, partial [Chitinophagales bacterium]|nr:5-(carboxyamino)imidazole ribonucleotide synthase [Chitinophagales bacterium]